MHNHYVPVYYLKGFTDPTTGMLWVYRKDHSSPFQNKPEKVCGQEDYYLDDTETYLRDAVEKKGHPVIAKIRKGEPITEADKRALSEYIAALVKRGPWSKNRFQEQGPQMLEDIGQNIHEALIRLKDNDPSKEHQCNERILELEEARAKHRADLPRSAWEAGFSPEKTPGLVDALNAMTWIFFVSGSEPVFLTCDNPIFLPNIDLEKGNSEFSFPVSSKVALWGSRRTDLSEGYLEANADIITQFNWRTGALFFRHLFAGFKAEWISEIATKKFPLNYLEVPKWNNKKITECYSFPSNS